MPHAQRLQGRASVMTSGGLANQSYAQWEQERRSPRARALALWRRLARRSVIRPVGPGAAGWAKVRNRSDSGALVQGYATRFFIAKAADRDGGPVLVH